MALIKKDPRLEEVSFSFGEDGDLENVSVCINYSLEEQSSGVKETRLRRTLSLWDRMGPEQRMKVSAAAKTIRSMVEEG